MKRLSSLIVSFAMIACDSPTSETSGEAAEPSVSSRSENEPRAEDPTTTVSEEEAVDVATEEEAAPEMIPRLEGDVRTLESNDGTYTVRWMPEPDPIPVNEPFEIVASVAPTSEPETSLAPDAFDVSIDAAMPHHGHGMNRSATMVIEDGLWHAKDMLFHMPGRWEIYFDITQGKATERAQIAVEVE